MNKLSKIISGPQTYLIRGEEVKIYPLDYEDTCNLMQLKRNADGDVINEDKENVKIIKDVMTKKLKQSFTEVVNGQKIEPTDEEINKIDLLFYTEYIKRLFEMVKVTSEEVKKK